MALTEAEELELLELEELEAEASSQKKSGLEKAVGISEKVQGAVAWPFQKAAEYIPGVAPVLGAVGKVAETVQKPFDIAGEKVAEFGGKIGVSPEVSAGIGTGVSMIPDIAASIAGAGPAKKGAQLGAKGVKAATSPIRKAVKLLKEPGEAEAKALAEQTRAAIKLKPTLAEKAVKRGKERIAPLTKKLQEAEQYKAGIKLTSAEKQTALESQLSEAGKEIGKLEEAAGLGLKQLPLPKPVTKARRFAQLMGKIADSPVETLGTKYDITKIQSMRKQAQIAAKSSGIPSEYKVLINQGREKLGQTLDTKLGESFEVARKNWQALDDKLAELPQETLKKQTVSSQLLRSTKAEIAKEKERISKLVQRSKKIDARNLAKVEAQLTSSIAKAAKRDAIISKLKTLSIGAAGAAGVGGLATALFK